MDSNHCDGHGSHLLHHDRWKGHYSSFYTPVLALALVLALVLAFAFVLLLLVLVLVLVLELFLASNRLIIDLHGFVTNDVVGVATTFDDDAADVDADVVIVVVVVVAVLMDAFERERAT